MAERRMFAKTIITSDAFIDMPTSARCLYFSLNIYADDDGFVNSPRQIMRMTGASDDDMKILIAKKFVLIFEDGVLVIKHWRIHNYIRNDRYVPTKYQDHKNELVLDENRAYKNKMDTNGIPNGYQMDTQDSIGKDRLGKDSVNIHTHAYEEFEDFITNIPTLQEIQEFITLKNFKNVDAERFKDYYDSVGWKKGNTPITNWQALVGMWEREQIKQDGLKNKTPQNFEEHQYTKEEHKQVYVDLNGNLEDLF